MGADAHTHARTRAKRACGVRRTRWDYLDIVVLVYRGSFINVFNMLKDVSEIASIFAREYSKTPKLVKIVDCFILYALATAAIQFAYMFIFGSFPYSAFLGGFFCSLGFAILTVCFRMKIDAQSPKKETKLERIFCRVLYCLYLSIFYCNNICWLNPCTQFS